MAWNEPGKDKDPWGGRGKNDGPPELDEAFKKLQDKLNGIFGGGGSGRPGGENSGLGVFWVIGLAVIAALYVGAGFYQVDTKERAVVLRFGAFHEITQEGLNWRWPLVDQVRVVNTTSTQQYASKGLMLTKDESIVELPLTVQYNVSNVKDYVLNVKEPSMSLQQATDSAVRHVVGSTELNQVLSDGREAIGVEVKQRLQSYLDGYGAGINVVSVNIQEARPPEEVRSAFDDVVKAKEDEAKLVNQAQAYANGVINEAKGRSQRMISEAEGYKAEVISKAEGESKRFEALYTQYKAAPEVTRERLYLDALEQVLESSSKVLVDVKGGNNMLYLPLDRLTGKTAATDKPPVTVPLDSSSYSSRVITPDTSSTSVIRREPR